MEKKGRFGAGSFIPLLPLRQPAALGVKHAGHVACGNKAPLGNLIRTITEKMGVRVDDRFWSTTENC